jgi:Trk K+ transport system NAD-binding subunit
LNEGGSRTETLRKAGTADADWFPARTGTDEVNIVACGLVGRLEAYTVLALFVRAFLRR